jgi:hypothetical protein
VAVIALVVKLLTSVLLSERLMAKHLVFGVNTAPITIDCLQCAASLLFYAASMAQFDASGFESYELECCQCGTSLAGIVDPYDDELLLSAKDKKSLTNILASFRSSVSKPSVVSPDRVRKVLEALKEATRNVAGQQKRWQPSGKRRPEHPLRPAAEHPKRRQADQQGRQPRGPRSFAQHLHAGGGNIMLEGNAFTAPQMLVEVNAATKAVDVTAIPGIQIAAVQQPEVQKGARSRHRAHRS